ncbi:vitamin-B12 independent methionine synthase family protein [Cutibacterium acnes JCM 18920]|nr:vitamin-B12 independent methionine synthase family protein [Cutibacterium acnes JCM 18920]
MLVNLPVDHGPGGWRLADSTDHAARSARSWLRSDLDDLEEVLADGETSVKLSFAGPLTLATGLHLRAGESILADGSALADVTTSLAEGVSQLIAELRRRMRGSPGHCRLTNLQLPQSFPARFPLSLACIATQLWQVRQQFSCGRPSCQAAERLRWVCTVAERRYRGHWRGKRDSRRCGAR